jgi:glyoxylase-like metal-dependent hydrolase (beta-lactamase superfamily II)
MKRINFKRYGSIEAFELGYGILHPPVMNVHFFLVDEVCIDTAQFLMRKHVLEIVRERKINQVLLTHFHEDHSGNAAAIQKEKHVPVYGHPETVKKMECGFSIRPYQYYLWGPSGRLSMDILPPLVESTRISLLPIHTPGHSPDHTAYLEKNEGWLFSGDLYLSSRIRYFRADETMDDTIRSLRNVLSLDFQDLFCAHNPILADGKKRIREKLKFLENFSGEVARLHDQGFDEKEIVDRLPHTEVVLVKLFTMGNVSLANMVRATLRARESSMKTDTAH